MASFPTESSPTNLEGLAVLDQSLDLQELSQCDPPRTARSHRQDLSRRRWRSVQPPVCESSLEGRPATLKHAQCVFSESTPFFKIVVTRVKRIQQEAVNRAIRDCRETVISACWPDEVIPVCCSQGRRSKGNRRHVVNTTQKTMLLLSALATCGPKGQRLRRT